MTDPIIWFVVEIAVGMWINILAMTFDWWPYNDG